MLLYYKTYFPRTSTNIGSPQVLKPRYPFFRLAGDGFRRLNVNYFTNQIRELSGRWIRSRVSQTFDLGIGIFCVSLSCCILSWNQAVLRTNYTVQKPDEADRDLISPTCVLYELCIQSRQMRPICPAIRYPIGYSN